LASCLPRALGSIQGVPVRHIRTERRPDKEEEMDTNSGTQEVFCPNCVRNARIVAALETSTGTLYFDGGQDFTLWWELECGHKACKPVYHGDTEDREIFVP
jgi:hypothetical protein